MPSKPIIAAIQLCSSDNVDENLLHAKKLMTEAAEGAQLIVLPEMFAIMGKNVGDALKVKETFGSGKIQDFLSEIASKTKTWIVGGTIPIASETENKKINAACIVFNDQGKAVARYDKIHMFDAIISDAESYRESDTTQAGTKSVVIDTPFGKLGLAVCFDLRFPQLFLELIRKGAEIIAVPAAFTLKTGQSHWELLLRSRAIDTFCYVVGSAQGGMHANHRKTYGHSMIIDPWGKILSQLSATDTGVIIAEIDHQYQKEIRRSIPVFTENNDNQLEVKEF